MGKKGLLKFGQFGMSMPVTDPYVPVPPVWSRHVEQFAINFETDYETAARKITGVTFVRVNSVLRPGYIVHDYLSGKQEA